MWIVTCDRLTLVAAEISWKSRMCGIAESRRWHSVIDIRRSTRSTLNPNGCSFREVPTLISYRQNRALNLAIDLRSRSWFSTRLSNSL